MQAQDKFGHPLYGVVFTRIQAIARQFAQMGYEEHPRKPNLFVIRYPSVAFWADFRGTEEVPMWEDPAALWYWQWTTPKGPPEPDDQRRMVALEWNRLGRIPRRLSFWAGEDDLRPEIIWEPDPGWPNGERPKGKRAPKGRDRPAMANPSPIEEPVEAALRKVAKEPPPPPRPSEDPRWWEGTWEAHLWRTGQRAKRRQGAEAKEPGTAE